MNPLNDSPQAEWIQNHKKYEEMEFTLSKGVKRWFKSSLTFLRIQHFSLFPRKPTF